MPDEGMPDEAVDRALSVRDAAKEHPGRVFLVDDEGTLTFAQAASALADDPTPGPRAFVASQSRQTVLAMLGAFERRLPLVPLHPRWTDVERERALSKVATSSRLDESHLAVLFTSGTSGTPKGALLSRRAFVRAAEASAERLGWYDDDRWLLAMPLAHVGGLSVLVRTLIARRTIVVARPGAFDPHATLDTIERRSVTLLSLVPTQLAQLALTGRPAPSSVRAVLLGGAACPPRILARAASLGWRLHTTYGLTEMCAQVSTSRAPVAHASEGVGEPLEGVEIEIREGRIHVRSPSRMDGWLDPSLPEPFDERGFYDTGDLGELDAHGRLFVHVRRDDLIVTGGENVYPAEVEQALMRLDDVEAACVVGMPDDTWGQRVAAVVVSRAPVDEDATIARLRDDLAAFKIPRTIVTIDALPTNAVGKVDRAKVREVVLSYEGRSGDPEPGGRRS